MGSINVGTIFALETDLPKYSEILGLYELDIATVLNSIQSWKIFHDMRDSDDKLNYLHRKEYEILQNTMQICRGDAFFETIVWLKYEMVQIRKLFRGYYVNNPNDQATLELNLDSIVYPSEKIKKLIYEFAISLPLSIEMFELETKLDELYLNIMDAHTGRNKYKIEYVKTIKKLQKKTAKIRVEYLYDDNNDNQVILEEINKSAAEKEVKYISDAIIKMNETATMLSYLIKIKYFFYNINLLLSGVSNKDGNLFIDYSFK